MIFCGAVQYVPQQNTIWQTIGGRRRWRLRRWWPRSQWPPPQYYNNNDVCVLGVTFVICDYPSRRKGTVESVCGMCDTCGEYVWRRNAEYLVCFDPVRVCVFGFSYDYELCFFRPRYGHN